MFEIGKNEISNEINEKNEIQDNHEISTFDSEQFLNDIFGIENEEKNLESKDLKNSDLNKASKFNSLGDFISDIFKESIDNKEMMKNCPIENGEWKGKRGDSEWTPNSDYVPQKKNPEQKTWGEILDKFGIDGIDFKEGEANFGDISKGDVEIESFSTNRDDNFDRADIKLAEQKGCTPEEVAKWRKENGYTWHECKDMKTMQKVASVVHNNISHRGGISEAKGGK